MKIFVPMTEVAFPHFEVGGRDGLFRSSLSNFERGRWICSCHLIQRKHEVDIPRQSRFALITAQYLSAIAFDGGVRPSTVRRAKFPDHGRRRLIHNQVEDAAGCRGPRTAAGPSKATSKTPPRTRLVRRLARAPRKFKAAGGTAGTRREGSCAPAQVAGGPGRPAVARARRRRTTSRKARSRSIQPDECVSRRWSIASSCGRRWLLPPEEIPVGGAHRTAASARPCSETEALGFSRILFLPTSRTAGGMIVTFLALLENDSP